MIRNRRTFRDRLARWAGSTVETDLREFDANLAAIETLAPELRGLPDDALAARGRTLAHQARGGEGLDALVVPAFALVREVTHRTLGLWPFPEQLVAGLALHRGAVVEMQTGEGKTLAAVAPAFLHALGGAGVHVLTVNDYLARRDADWMGPIYRRLGLEVAALGGTSPAAERRAAYRADITYLTAKEAGFDHLRDLAATDPAAVVQRAFHFALVDEADSLLIDEARAPLVLAGDAPRSASSAERLAALVATLRSGIDFDTTEDSRDVELTEAGAERVEAELGLASLYAEESFHLLTELNCALHAQVLLRRDVDYLVRGGRVELVDELTGRVVADRHWPDGLQAALEAKEGVARRPDGRILGSISLQHFLGLYPRLAGMTGTAVDAARELHELYRLPVVVVPTHRPVVRRDHPDLVFTHREAKERAVVGTVARLHGTGRPVLVGTASVEESERLAERVRGAGFDCQVLNAVHDAEEAAIVARAGTFGAITIATNMAGRGTDIRLGGPDEADRERIAALGGLFVLGTHRHESPRIDRQLRGRAGRQGDPGESRFYVSLEDSLVQRWGLDALVSSRNLPTRQDAPLDSPVLAAEIAHAQRMLDGQNFEIRRTLWRYSSAIEDQRRALFDRRQALLSGTERPAIWRREAERHGRLAGRHGIAALDAAERAVTLLHLDRAWSDHLALVADLKEGSHLAGLGGADPLTRFKVTTARAFDRLEEEVEEAVLAELADLERLGPDLERLATRLKGPSSTWTYRVSDDPFRNQLASTLTTPGAASMTIGAALFAPMLFALWMLVERIKRRRRSPDV